MTNKNKVELKSSLLNVVPEIDAMSLVRMCEVSVSTAYKALGDTPVDISSAWKIYVGLRDAGVSIESFDKFVGYEVKE